jgi:sterol 3beta-glucosyltransferase
MRILIMTMGTRGDVQPYIALALGLSRAGHSVTLATLTAFEDMVREHGLAFAPLRGDFLEMLQTPQGKAAVVGKANPLELWRQARPRLRRLLDEQPEAARGADAIIFHPKTMGGQSLAERFDVPGIMALLQPLYAPTRTFASMLMPADNLGGALNLASHRLTNWAMGAAVSGVLNRWREESLGLGPVRDQLTLHGRPLPRIYGYSPQVLPAPPDWAPECAVAGYWFLERAPDWRPPERLEAFLQDGPPPVYVGFGSMPSRDAQAQTRLVLEALAQSGQRGVLATGWGGLAAADVPADVYLLDAAPHDWLFPRVAAVVHHGGAGTTAAGLRAGVPNVICPFFGDQPFWGRRVAALGVGPQPCPQQRLSVGRLAEAIRAAVEDSAMRERAAVLGARIRAEDGVARAVELVERRLGVGNPAQGVRGVAV